MVFFRWAISFTRANDKVLGVYLILRDTSPSATCYADFTLSLLNREHFSRNEQYSEKQCKFTSDHPAHVCMPFYYAIIFLLADCREPI